MTTTAKFPKLGDWAGTRQTLHAYCKVLGAIRGAFAPPHPKWWHVSLLPYTAGLTTTHIPFPEDAARSFSLSLDLRNHYALLSTSDGNVEQFRLMEGQTATALGELLISKLAGMGVEGEVARDKFEDDEAREYVMADAERYFSALSQVARIFKAFKGGLKGETGTVQLWPHHFDLSLELFGEKTVKTEEGEYPSQIGFGFAPKDESQPAEYFYANPYPFEDAVTKEPLPEGVSWYTDSWKGALLPYGEIAEKADGEDILVAYLQAAYAAGKKFI